MNETLLERIGQLERSVRGWRLACLALTLVVVSLLAIGGTFGIVLMLGQQNTRMLEEREMVAREEAQQAMREAMRAERVARQQVEQAERAARQQREGRNKQP